MILYPYSINIADLIEKGDRMFNDMVLCPVCPNHLTRIIDKDRPDTNSLVLECMNDQAKAIIEIMRYRYKKNELRAYYGKQRI